MPDNRKERSGWYDLLASALELEGLRKSLAMLDHLYGEMLADEDVSGNGMLFNLGTALKSATLKGTHNRVWSYFDAIRRPWDLDRIRHEGQTQGDRVLTLWKHLGDDQPDEGTSPESETPKDMPSTYSGGSSQALAPSSAKVGIPGLCVPLLRVATEHSAPNEPSTQGGIMRSGIPLTTQSDMEAEVRSLLVRLTEGQHWDFKQEHHKFKSDLIHDVLCLANTEHKGPRYLIFGVGSNGQDLYCQKKAKGRRSPEDITSLFVDNTGKFFQDRIPELHMFELEVDGCALDVLVIEDRPFKPYHLVGEYKEGGGKPVHPYHIYSRRNSVNTARNASAAPDAIVDMWRERFGLTLSPRERFLMYLMDREGWESAGWRTGWDWMLFYRDFPEFNLRKQEHSDKFHEVDINQEWTQGEIAESRGWCWYELYYHETCLYTIPQIIFDGGKKSMIIPDWEPRGRGRFYFYTQGTLRYAVNMFSSKGEAVPISVPFHKLEADKDLASRMKKHRTNNGELCLPVVSPHELEEFLGDEQQRRTEADRDHYRNGDPRQYHAFMRNLLDFADFREARSRAQP